MNVIHQPHAEQMSEDPLIRFSRGEISRQRAMRELGDITYGELLDRIAERRLPLPRLPPEREGAMIDRMDALLAGQ
jgi:hypothetical protein